MHGISHETIVNMSIPTGSLNINQSGAWGDFEVVPLNAGTLMLCSVDQYPVDLFYRGRF
jgi:hypothetical protein